MEISSDKELPIMVSMELEGGDIVNIHVEHEWTPPLCKKCRSFGHIKNQCPPIKVCREKEKEIQGGVEENSITKKLGILMI